MTAVIDDEIVGTGTIIIEVGMTAVIDGKIAGTGTIVIEVEMTVVIDDEAVEIEMTEIGGIIMIVKCI